MSILKTIWYLLTYITYTNSQLNQWIKQNGTNGEDIWLSTSDFIPRQSQSFGTIRLGQIMSMEFDFTFGGRTNYPQIGFYEQFFRIGYNSKISKTCNGEGARYPSFWLSNDADTMHLSVSSGLICQPKHYLNDYGIITIGSTYHIKIAFNNTILEITISQVGKPTWIKRWSRKPTPDIYIGEVVPVWWMSNKYSGTYNVGNGTFRNVILKSNIFTMEPTIAPTYVTGNPTMSVSSYAPTMTTIVSDTTSTISSTETGAMVTEAKDEVEFDNDFQEGALDGTIVGIIIAVIAVFCCLCCGIIILWKNRKKYKHKSSETDNGMSFYEKKQLEAEMNNDIEKQSLQEVGVVYTTGGEIEYNEITEDIFTPDGYLKNQIIPVDSKQEQYLSPAQKQQLNSTPGGPNHEKKRLYVTDGGGNVYDEYLSPAQKEEIVKQNSITPGMSDSDDNKTSDDEIIADMKTAGYIGIGNINGNKQALIVHKENSDSDMSDEIPIEKKLTIGGEDSSESSDNYDDGLSELTESNDITIQ